MRKKVVVLGGGTGMSSLLYGLKEFPLDITSVVSVCDDGKSTGRLREEFHIPAVGDIRKVIVSLSETDEMVEKLLNYRFKTTSDLDGHTVGNLLLAAMANMTGNMSDGIEALGKVLNLKGKILPLTEDNVVLCAKMTDGSTVEGEHNITESSKIVASVYYKEPVEVNPEVIKAINEADAVILSMGSIYTSIIPNLLCKDIIKALDTCKAPIIYTCNMMTQPGETDGLSVSEHVKIMDNYLGKKKISVVVANNGKISEETKKRYETLEQKDEVKLDLENLKDIKVIKNNYVTIVDEYLRHDAIALSVDLFKYIIKLK